VRICSLKFLGVFYRRGSETGAPGFLKIDLEGAAMRFSEPIGTVNYRQGSSFLLWTHEPNIGTRVLGTYPANPPKLAKLFRGNL
jgi:hypothetical protein